MVEGQNINLNDIDPNSRTIEMDGGFGIIVDGKHKGLKFVKKKGTEIRIIGFDESFLKKMKVMMGVDE